MELILRRMKKNKIILKINNRRKKVIVADLIASFIIFVFAFFSISALSEIYAYSLWCVVVWCIIGFFMFFSFYKKLFRWKIIIITLEGVHEEYYSILQKNPYKITRILSWRKVKNVCLIKRKINWKNQPCAVNINYFNDKGQGDSYCIDTASLYFFDYKGLEYDPIVVDCLNEINKTYTFKIVYE